MLTSPLLDVRTSNPTSVTLASPRSRFSARNSTVLPVAGLTSIGPLKFRTVNWPPAGIVPRHVYTVSLRPTIWASATAETAPVSVRARRRVGRVDRIAITWVEGWDGLPRVRHPRRPQGWNGFSPSNRLGVRALGSDPNGLSCAARAGPGTPPPRGTRGRRNQPAGTP